MVSRRARAHRPVPLPDLTALIDAAGGSWSHSRAEIASATAAAVVHAGRQATPAAGQAPPSAPAGESVVDRFVGLADLVGLETLASLWCDAEPTTLPGALWTLYLLRQWCRTRSADVVRLWRAGEPYAPADAVVAGVGEYADVEAVARFGDAVLSGAYRGDLAVALERAAAFFRVIAAGRRQGLAIDNLPDEDGPDSSMLADRNERAASDLTAAAARWRSGTLC
jgi:hypothetical protein